MSNMSTETKPLEITGMDCPKCGHEPSGDEPNITYHWVPYPSDAGGSGHRTFNCEKCGTLLLEDISS